MDNRYWSQGCPPLMSDGKFITNHVRGKVFDQYIRNMNDITGTHQFRNFLQNRGGDILQLERESIIKNNTCSVNGKCVPLSGKPLSTKDALNVLPSSSSYSTENFENVKIIKKNNLNLKILRDDGTIKNVIDTIIFDNEI
jgi:hypothetical protein